MNITVIGTGYVGLVSGTCFAEMGHQVTCVDVDERKINQLNQSKIPIYEPGLEELVVNNKTAGRLEFTTELGPAVRSAQCIFIAVGTPPGEDGSADLRHVLGVAQNIATHMNEYKVIVNKSTVPVGTADKVKQVIFEELKKHSKHDLEFDVVSNPEFLKEGDAISDFMRPDRVIIGTENQKSREIMEELYAPFIRNGHPFIAMDVRSCELTKYAANAMLATRISFMNELSQLCEKTGADIEQIRKGIGTDKRIGMPFLYAGIGYGGSCFPKDVQAIIQTMNQVGVNNTLMRSVELVNRFQKEYFADKVSCYFKSQLAHKHFAVWGLSFKPKTDDVRESPAIAIIQKLHEWGASFSVFDPEALETAKALLPKNRITFANSMYEALPQADALLLLTEWNEFRNPDFKKMASLMRNKILFDGRNQYNPEKMKHDGWSYHCVGRPT